LHPPLGFLAEIIDAHLLKEDFLGYFWHFLMEGLQLGFVLMNAW
jgi:hypothetical protein